MKVVHDSDVAQHTVTMPGATGCTVRWLITESDQTPTFAMRQFEVQPGGFTPRHSHPYEHEVYVLAGEGVVYEGDHTHPLTPGTCVLVRPDEVHQFQNTGESPLRFLCLVPNHIQNLPVTAAPECAAIEPTASSA